MKITLDANYRLPSGRVMAESYARIFALQHKEVLQYVRSGRTTPINMNGWLDYTVEKTLPVYLWYVARGWRFQARRLEAKLPKHKASWTGLFKAKTRKEEDDERRRKEWILLGLLALMAPEMIDEVRQQVRRIVALILGTSAKQVNRVLEVYRQSLLSGFQDIEKQDVLEAVAGVFSDPGRLTNIGETEASRAYHTGMVSVLQQSKYRWLKTWKTAEDEKVCPVCLPLHGVTIPLDQTFASEPKSGSYDGMLTLINVPPAHPGTCRCKLEIFVEIDPVEFMNVTAPRGELV